MSQRSPSPSRTSRSPSPLRKKDDYRSTRPRRQKNGPRVALFTNFPRNATLSTVSNLIGRLLESTDPSNIQRVALWTYRKGVSACVQFRTYAMMYHALNALKDDSGKAFVDENGQTGFVMGTVMKFEDLRRVETDIIDGRFPVENHTGFHTHRRRPRHGHYRRYDSRRRERSRSPRPLRRPVDNYIDKGERPPYARRSRSSRYGPYHRHEDRDRDRYDYRRERSHRSRSRSPRYTRRQSHVKKRDYKSHDAPAEPFGTGDAFGYHSNFAWSSESSMPYPSSSITPSNGAFSPYKKDEMEKHVQDFNDV